MTPTDESASFEPKVTAADRRKPGAAAATAAPAQSPDLVALTLDATTGKIVKVECVDAAGAHREISDDDRARLAGSEARATLEQVVEQAFEAGIDCVLGSADEEASAESDEDAELSRLVLRSLIKRSAARSLIGRESLRQAIVGTLVEQAAAYPAAATEGAAAH